MVLLGVCSRAHGKPCFRSLRLSHYITSRFSLPYEKLNNLFVKYEDFVGLTVVKAAQDAVLQAEGRFLEAQAQRRASQEAVQNLQARIKDVQADLKFSTDKSEERYIDLVHREHELIKEEKMLMAEFGRLERGEREEFSKLSASLRESHEKERQRAERTKYWSIIGSAIGALVGITGTTINNRVRMRELRSLVTTAAVANDNSSDNSGFAIEDKLKSMTKLLEDHRSQILESIDGVNLSLLTTTTAASPGKGKETQHLLSAVQNLLKAIENESKLYHADMEELKRIMALQLTSEQSGGSELDPQTPLILLSEHKLADFLQKTENNIKGGRWRRIIESCAVTSVCIASLYVLISISVDFGLS